MVPKDKLAVTKYHEGTRIFNFHSIQPDFNDPEYTLTLLGENILNTLESNLSITYNRAEQWKRVGFSAVYGGLYPFLNGTVNYTIDRRGRYHNKIVYWNEIEPSAGTSLSLDLSKNRSITHLDLGSSYTYNQSDFQGIYKDSIGRIAYSYLNNYVTFSHQLQKSARQIFPSFAQAISLSYKHALTNYDASQFVASGNLLIRGIGRNHSLVLNGAFLQKDTLGQLDFSNNFPFSRGYSSVNLYRMIKWGATYHVPLLYPDAGIGNILYITRLRGALFYDYTHVKDFYSNGAPFRARFRSAGSEVYFDTKWWNQIPLTFGIRYSRLLDTDIFGTSTGKNRWELILPVNIFNQ